MKLKLIKGSPKYRDKITDMLREWTDYNNEHPEANTSPWAIFKDDYRDFEHYIENLDRREAKDGFVPDSTWFCLDDDRDMLVGAVNIRHYLNDFLLMYGGHIGDGIRPSERGKGYGTLMIGLALGECKKIGIDRALLVCRRDNIASAKSIINNGGILENEVEHEGEILQRYWIDIK